MVFEEAEAIHQSANVHQRGRRSAFEALAGDLAIDVGIGMPILVPLDVKTEDSRFIGCAQFKA